MTAMATMRSLFLLALATGLQVMRFHTFLRMLWGGWRERRWLRGPDEQRPVLFAGRAAAVQHAWPTTIVFGSNEGEHAMGSGHIFVSGKRPAWSTHG